MPSFGDWGFVIASRRQDFTVPTHYSAPTRWLDAQTASDMFHFPADMPQLAMPPNYLNDQPLVRLFRKGRTISHFAKQPYFARHSVNVSFSVGQAAGTASDSR